MNYLFIINYNYNLTNDTIYVIIKRFFIYLKVFEIFTI